MTRDMTFKQFEKACQRHGFRDASFGYVEVGNGLRVYARNAGPRYRDQLAYLIREAAKEQKRAELR